MNEEIISIDNIKDWDPNTLPENFSLGIFGVRRKGKSWLLKHILSSIKNRFDEVYLFSMTATLQGELFSYVPKHNRFNGLDQGKLQEIFDRQREAVEEAKQFEEIDKRKYTKLMKKIKRPLLIFDDIVTDEKIKKSKVFNDLFVFGRHFLLNVAILAQTISGRREGMSPIALKNMDAVIAFYLDAQADRENVIRRYASRETWKQGDEYFKSITQEDFCACVIDVTDRNARKCCDYMYKIKAPEKLKNFKIGQHLKSKIKHVPTETEGMVQNGAGRDTFRIQIPVHFGDEDEFRVEDK